MQQRTDTQAASDSADGAAAADSRSAASTVETRGLVVDLPRLVVDLPRLVVDLPRLVVDLRSDTVTRPTAAMRQAMLQAEVGDDGFGDDPTVLALQARVAALLQKEAAMFVPSGTMANQIAIRLHTQPGDAMICHRQCHIAHHEAGAAPALSGVTLLTVDSDDGTLGVDDVAALLFVGEDGRTPPTRLVAIENTHNMCGGRVVAQPQIDAVAALARHAGVALHLDGARLWNTHVATGRSLGELAAPFTTVSVCLSKGLGAPAGSALAGPSELILRAKRLRRMFGGMMRQVGVLAAAGLYALDNHLERLAEDHRRAELLAGALAEIPGVHVVSPDTNIVRFRLNGDHPIARAAMRGEADLVALAAAQGLGLTGAGGTFRAVTHLQIDDDALNLAVDILQALLASSRQLRT